MSEFRLERDRNFEQEPYIYRVYSLDGGLVPSFSPRLLDQQRGYSSDILNVEFEYPGIPNKRKGTEDYLDDAPDSVRGLYEFERTFTEDKYVLLACANGKLYRWDDTVWVEVKDALPDEEPDFNSFADQVVVAYPSHNLFSWNGEEFKEDLGAEKADLETFFIFENNDLRFVAKEAGIEGNYIRVAIVEPETETGDIAIVTEGEQTEEDPFIITITPEWRDITKHQMRVYLGNPSGGNWKVGDPFTMVDVDYDITASGLQDVLRDLYGSDEVDVVEDNDFIVTFNTLVNSHMRADFAGLEGTTDPVSEQHQEYEDAEILSTAQEIKDAVEADVNANEIVEVELIGDGTGKVYQFNESSLTGGFDSVKGAFLEDFRTRLLLSGDPEDPNLLRSSHTGDPSLWDPYASGSNAFELYVGPDDGTKVTGLLEMGDGGILIGKERSTYALFGYTRENMIVDLVDSHVGVINHKSMGFVKPYALFVSKDGVYRYESGQLPEKVSLPVQEIFDNEVDHSKLEESSAFTTERSYILSLPSVDGGSVVLVYYADQDKWTKWDEPNGKFFTDYSELDKGFLFSERESVKMKRFGIEDKTGFVSRLTTVQMDAELPERVKYFGEAYIIFRTAEDPYEVQVSVGLDGRTLQEFTKNEIIEGEKGKQTVLRIAIGKEARFMEISISGETTKSGFHPMSVIYTYKPHGVL